MVFLIIAFSVIGSFLIYFAVCYIVSGKIYEKMFSARHEPDKRITFYTNEEFGIDKDLYKVECPEGNIVGYFYHKDDYDKTKLVIFCHGMNSSKEDYVQEACYIASKGYLVYMFDYLGTNESSGESLKGFSDGIYSLDMVLNQLNKDEKYKDLDLYVMGHSWGGYTCTSIVKLHPEVKGILGISPMISVFESSFHAPGNRPFFHALAFAMYDKFVFPSRYRINVKKALESYSGKIILVQSEDDPVVSFNSSVGYLRKKCKNKNIEYIVLQNRLHNPDYTDQAVQNWKAFNDAYRAAEDKDKVFEETDFHACGEIDTSLWDTMLSKMFQ